MDIIGLVKAVMGLAQSIMDKVLYDKIMAYLDEYEQNEVNIDAEKALYPNWDDAKMESLIQNKARLKDAINQQAALVKPATPTTTA